MKTLPVPPNLVAQVHDAILGDIASGQLAPGERIVQEQLATALGVSRQPVQQALLLLRSEGLLHEAPGRGLIIAPLDPVHVRHMYDVRAVIEGLAARRAAEMNPTRAAAEGPALLEAGWAAVASGGLTDLISTDMRFHSFVYELAGNPLIGPSMATHWAYTQRVMGEVLMRDQNQPRDIWVQHEQILLAIGAGDGPRAEMLGRQHIAQAADFMIMRLRAEAAND